MPRTRPARLIYALVVCLALLVIGRNLYRRYLNSQLLAAVEARNAVVARSLLMHGADPNTKKPDPAGRGPGVPLLSLLVTSYQGISQEQQEIACLLIERGVNIREDVHDSYLESACYAGAVSVVGALLKHGANATFVDINHTTPMDKALDFIGVDTPPAAPHVVATAYGAAVYSQPERPYPTRLALGLEMIRLLQQHGAQITPWQAIKINDLNSLRATLDTGFPLETKEPVRAMSSTTKGPTLLQVAAQSGNNKAVRLLLLRGANVNASDTANPSALDQAIRNHHEDVARLLLAHGADVNAPGSSFYPLLPDAVLNLPSIVPALLEHRIDLKKQGVMALCEAMRSRQPALVTLLLQKGVSCQGPAGTPALATAIEYRPDLVPLLLQRGASAQGMSPQGESLLYEAVHYEREDLLLPLLAAGARGSTTGSSRSPLLEAIGKKPSMVKVLLEHGADPNNASGYNPVPLCAAAQTGNVEAVQLLLLHGADVNGKGNLPHTPLYYARKHKQEKIAALLQQAGARE